jgi:hypothetical protein
MTVCLQSARTRAWFHAIHVACGLVVPGLAVALGIAGCGGSEREATADASPGRDASRADAAMPDAPVPDAPAPDAPAPDAPPGPGPGFVSNTPNATVVDVGIPATPNLVLISSNLLQEPSGSQFFQQWAAEVRNAGSTTVCGLLADVSFRNESGGQLAVFEPFTSTAPYQLSGLSVTINCLAPGDIGTFFDNGFAPALVDLGAVTRIEIAIISLGAGSAIPAPHAPIVASHVEPVFDGFGIAGTLTGNVGPIHTILIDGFPRDANGLVLGWLFDSDGEQLDPGEVVPFSTLDVSTSFSLHRVFTQFIDGPELAPGGGARTLATAGDSAVETALRRGASRRAAAEQTSASRARAAQP